MLNLKASNGCILVGQTSICGLSFHRNNKAEWCGNQIKLLVIMGGWKVANWCPQKLFSGAM